jgi:hypothetical protein
MIRPPVPAARAHRLVNATGALPMTRAAQGRAATVAVFALLAAAAVTPAPAQAQAQVQDPNYPLLVNRFGELCTMCEATVACAAGPSAPADVAALAAPGSAWTLYHFQTKDFWGQVATIFKYLERWIRPVVREERPVVVYTSGPGGGRVDTLAALSLDPPRIEVGDRRIDRRIDNGSAAWQDGAGSPVGQCARLPLRETLAFLKTMATGTPEAR